MRKQFETIEDDHKAFIEAQHMRPGRDLRQNPRALCGQAAASLHLNDIQAAKPKRAPRLSEPCTIIVKQALLWPGFQAANR